MYYNWSAFKSQNDQSRHAWEPWGTETSSHSAINYPLNHSLFNYLPPPPPAGGVSAAMMNRGCSPFLVGREGENGEPCIYYNLDPHLMCLKLGKRQYFEDVTGVTSSTPIVIEDDTAAVGHGVSPVERKGKTSYGDSPPMAPRCQVEGCETGLVNAKDYHRRHKVCQMHAKAPKVVVLGIAQRFCQQCSRFHAVEQFDDSKRSCRRRLAGHNERRRKSSLNQPHLLGKLYNTVHSRPASSGLLPKQQRVCSLSSVIGKYLRSLEPYGVSGSSGTMQRRTAGPHRRESRQPAAGRYLQCWIRTEAKPDTGPNAGSEFTIRPFI